MIKKIYKRASLATTFLVISSLSVFAQKQNFTIEGKFSNWQDRGPVVLQYISNNAVVADTSAVVNGKFKFKGTFEAPTRVAIYSIAAVQGRTKDNTNFYLDKGKVILNGTDSLKTALIQGTELTKEGKLLDSQTKPITDKLVALRIKANELLKDPTKKEEVEALNGPYKKLVDSLTATKINFIKSHPKSYLSVITLNEFTGGNIDTELVGSIWNTLSVNNKETQLAKEINQKVAIAKRVGIGAIMPDFTSLDTSKQELTLKEVVSKGKVTLVDFWASWCLPCRKENPNIIKAYQAFHDKGFNILSVSLDKSDQAWKKAIIDDNMGWYHVSSLKYWDEPIAKSFGITGVPDSFLLDADGKVIARGLRAEQLFKKLEDILN